MPIEVTLLPIEVTFEVTFYIMYLTHIGIE